MHAKRKNLRAISLEWRQALQEQRAPFFGEIGNILDDFRERCTTPEERLALVGEPPQPTGQPETDAYLAALAESLCREFALQPPAWTQHPRYFLRQPWFAGSMQSLKAILLAESPAAFRRRNLFISANALHRV